MGVLVAAIKTGAGWVTVAKFAPCDRAVLDANSTVTVGVKCAIAVSEAPGGTPSLAWAAPARLTSNSGLVLDVPDGS